MRTALVAAWLALLAPAIAFAQAPPPGVGTTANPQAITAAGAITATASDPAQITLGTTSTTLVPATAAGAPRMRAFLINLSTANTAWCRNDGGTATVGTGVPLFYNAGSYQYNYPGAGTAAINCVCTAASCPVNVEYVQ